MKLALVSYMQRDEGQIPIGLLTLAELARREGVRDVRVHDLPSRGDEDVFIASLCECDVVGFSSICSTYNQTIRLCRKLKEARPEIRIVLGGPQASLTAQESIIAFPFVEAVFQGEAEHSWLSFLRAAKGQPGAWEHVPGVVWRDPQGDVRRTPPAPLVQDLGTVPFPALDLYEFRRGAITPIEIGRGCPFSCSFCSSSPFFRRAFRLKPVDRILEEMDRLHDRYGSAVFSFVQDSFSNDRRFVESLCAALRQHRRSYAWYCSARADQVSDPMIATMKAAGCRGVYFGLETGSQRMQALIHKKLVVEHALRVIQRTSEAGLSVTASMIIGFPDETAADLRDTLRAFLELAASGRVVVQLHVLAPLPGSELIRQANPLGYDGMPSDFSDMTQVLDAEDHALVERHPDVFTSFWHFVNPSIPRVRFLFLARFLGMASVHFPDTLRWAAASRRDELVDRLLDGAVPSGFISDSGAPGPDGGGGAIEQTGELLDELIRPIETRALRAVIDEACGPCGACCLDEGGILCGADEWPMIRDGLAASGAGDLARSPVKGTDLISVETHRYVVYESPSDREDAQVRRACVAVGFREGRWRCAIERVKPAGCIAYPLKLLLHESPAGHPQRVIALELEDCSSRDPCALEKALRCDRELLDAYREAVRQRICHREGTFALAEYNRSRRSLVRDRQAGSAP